MSCFLYVLAAFILIFVIVLIYAGALKWFTIKVIETSQMPLDRSLVVYRPHIGAYKNCWVAFCELKILLAATGKSSCRTFGVYYDDPKEGKDRCRYIVGAILAEGGEIDKQDTERSAAIAHFKENGFKEAILPKIERGLYTNFPYRAGLLSIWLAVFIVYRAMHKAMTKVALKDDGKDRGIMEICDPHVMHYIFPTDEPADKLHVPDFKSKTN